MRAHAPFPILLATAALLTLIFLLPASSEAKTLKNHVPRQPRAAHHPKAVHPPSHVHKVGKHERHVSLPKAAPRNGRAGQTTTADTATSNRVHDWVKNQNKSPSGVPSKATDAANHHDEQQPGAATGVSNPPADHVEADRTQADDRKPVSVISTIRNAETTGADKPQLPPVEALAGEPVILPTLYNKRGRLIVPPALKGSHEILIHQNQMADNEGLDRIRDDEDLERMRKNGMLVPLPTNSTLHTDERLPANRRYCRPWTALFLDTLARQHYAHFQTALQINSAVRTVEFQQRLIHTNGNAAPAEGDTASPHLTGQAIDIAKHGLTMAEIAWLRGYLLPLVQQGKVDVEEEFQQSCFHISVYKKYMPQADRRVIATTHREGIGTLGMSLQ